MSIDYAKKLLAIRKAEGMTQQKFAEITGLSLGFIKIYESGHRPARSETIEKVIQTKKFKKYTLWLMTGEVAPLAGQIEPAFSLSGSGVSEKKDQRKSFHMKGDGC
ncbi:MAG: XRE family transcriptional regulator [Candidatus Symbiopectobacterium sp. Dall1.0]|nr:XRE family transcriptional regulator [Candidatus Symbiopectobacterium sp. Dall1.0]